MFKPIRTVWLKTVGLSMRFVRKITGHAAIIGSYELSESELVFAMGAAREKNDLLSVLELLDKVLDLIRRGFDRHVNAITLRIINNVGIMLGNGGFSREYFNTAEIYNKISAAVYGENENFNISECRSEINKQLSVLRSEQMNQIRGNTHKSFGAKALRFFKTVSDRETLTVNTLNPGLLRITARNPELVKMLKHDKAFMELSLKNIEHIHRRTERAVTTQRFLGSLTAEQIGLLERFVVNENLFSELRGSSIKKLDLKYLLANSSEKSIAEFFETLKEKLGQKIEFQSTTQSEQSYFNSAEEMKEFFVAAQQGDIERLIKTIEADRLDSVEAKTLAEALRIYKERAKKSVKPKNPDNESEALTEFFRNSETALNYIKQRINNENFSSERFISALGASGELKKIFAEYAWENYRSDETLSRYAEYIGSTASDFVNKDKLSDSDQTVFHIDSSIITEADIDVTSMMSFAEFLINSGELVLKLSESVKNNFLSASPDIVSAFAEYLVNTVREDSLGYYSEQIRTIAEKAENILYYGDPNFEERSVGNYSRVFSLISDAWNENALQLSELYTSFTQSQVGSEEILRLYSYLPKTNFKAVSEFFEAAAQGDKYFLDLSEELLDRSHSVSNNIGVFDIKEESADAYSTFYDVLCDMPENTLNLLLPLAGVNSGSVFGGKDTSFAPDNSRNNTFVDNFNNDSLADQTSALIAAMIFAEYLSDTVRSDISDRYNERTHSFAERLWEILHGEPRNINNINEIIRERRSAEAIDLIYNEWNFDHTQISELYKSFTQSFSNREDILQLYSGMSQSDLTDVSNSVIVNNSALFSGLNDVFSKQAETFFEQIKDLKNITSTDFYNAKDRGSDNSGTPENTSELILSPADQVSALTAVMVFAEYLSDTVRSDISDRYNERTHSLAERLWEIIHGEPRNINNINESIRESRSAEAIDLIYNEWDYDHTQISELYKNFTQSFSNREDILRLYSRLPQSDLTDVSNSVIVNSAANFFGLNGVFSKQADTFFEQIKGLKNITSTDFYNAEDRGSDNSEALENTSELIFSLADINNSTFSEQMPDTTSNSNNVFAANELSRILADLTSLSSVLNRSERRIYNITQAENKSIVTNKAVYSAFTALFGNDASENITNSIFSEIFYPAAPLTPREIFFTWESDNITLFNRMKADKIHTGISGFFEKRSSAVLTLSDRISEKFSSEYQSYSDRTATELFYTDEYFERGSGVTGSQTVNYALPAADFGSSDEVSEKIGNIREAIDNINTELVGIRQREAEISSEFVKKTEQIIFEKELKSSIERDIYLAGKRHGIY